MAKRVDGSLRSQPEMDREERRKKVIEEFKALWKFSHPEFINHIVEMCETHEVKNKAYGGGNPLGNFEESERLGIQSWKGAMVRLTDKYTRMCNLTKNIGNPEYADARDMESLDDTLIDLSNYGIIVAVLFNKQKAKRVFKEVLDKPYPPENDQVSVASSGSS